MSNSGPGEPRSVLVTFRCVTSWCEREPTFRFTWPGRDESAACEECALRAASAAKAMGLHLQIRALSVSAAQSERILSALGTWCEMERGRLLVITHQDSGRIRVAMFTKPEPGDTGIGHEVAACSGESLRDALAQVAQVLL